MTGPEDEILDRPHQASHFCCCVCAPCTTGVGIASEDGAVSDAFDDEILDRPWYAGCYCPYTICVHPPVPRSADEEILDQPRQADVLGTASNGSDPMVDVMLLAGASLLAGDVRRGSSRQS